MNRPPGDHLRPGDTPPVGTPAYGADVSGDIDSEPRRKWKPNPKLLQRLAEARRDLKPGESSLFWDWTTTRGAAPEAEDLRPSGEGEVLVSDKDAAAAYVPPVEVSPVRPQRIPTKSRIRVREDLDPRRQPTIRTARGSDPAKGKSTPPPSGRPSAASLVPPSSDSVAPWTPPERAAVPHPTHAQERRRRVAWAVFLGVLTGTVVFFWLRFPRDPGDRPAAQPPADAALSSIPPATVARTSTAPRATSTAPGGVPEAGPRGDAAPDQAGSARPATSATSTGRGAVAPARPAQGAQAAPSPATSSLPASATNAPPTAASPTAASPPAAQRPEPQGAASSTLTAMANAPRPQGAATPEPAASAADGGGFLIRKKGPK